MTLNNPPHPYSNDIRQLDTITIAQPAAGTSIDFTSSDGERIELLSASFSLTLANVGAARAVTITLTYATIGTIIAYGPVEQAINTTVAYTAMAGGTNFIDPTPTNAVIAMPQRLMIPVGATLAIDVDGIAVGDQFTAANLLYFYYKELA